MRQSARNGLALAALDSALGDVAPYLWNLLAIQEQPDPLAQMDAQVKRQRTLDAIEDLFCAKVWSNRWW